MAEQHISRVLSKGWKFRSSGSTEWRSAKVPSEVHTELLRHERIPDPFVGLNELQCAWVAEKAWHYRTEFPTPSGVADHNGSNNSGDDTTRVDLVLEGLDTFATVLLNGVVILESDNMFLSHRVDVAGVIHRDRSNPNALEIVFAPAREEGLELVRAHPEHEFIVHQTEVSRGPVRKAQYHWGWDWGPILLTCGPWRPVRLEAYRARIDDVRVDYDVDLSGEQPAVTMRITVAAVGWPGGAVGETRVAVSLDGERLYLSGALEAEDGAGGKETVWKYTSEEARIPNAKLWWPRGYGDQHMYRVRIQLIRHGIVLDDREHVYGFRKVELVQEADGFGQSFYFRINGVDVFCGGSCWIPADSFVSRITPDRYKRWIQMMAEGNQNMVRVWGGGIYESTAFYEACDELGIMVWQDFMFACASYPTYPSFLRSVEAEAHDNLQRIRHHPSVVLWCGNNEDYQLIERYNLEYNFDTDKDPQSWLKSTFPARYIYEHLLPGIVKVESPWTIYHPGSPWGNGRSTTLKVDPTVGDIHQWNMWHGDMRKYQDLPDMSGRFVSEFGMAAYPHLSTLHHFLGTKTSEWHPGSATLEFHNKAVGHSRRLLCYVTENFRLPSCSSPSSSELAAFAHLTQVMQSDAMAWAYKSWRRQWNVPHSRRCGGVLVWQLNDCWPCVSWSVIDYHLVPKPAYYTIRRALAPVAVSVSRKVYDWTMRPADPLWRRDTGHIDPTRSMKEAEFDVWVVSSRTRPVRGKVVLRLLSLSSGEDVVHDRIEKEITIAPNSCTEVWNAANVADYKLDPPFPGYVVIHVSLWDLELGRQISSDVSWPEPIKYLDFGPPEERGVRVDVVSSGNSDGEEGEDRDADGGGRNITVVEITVAKPVKGFVFSERPGVEVSDNGLDPIPGEPVRVEIRGGEPGEVLPWTFIGQ